MCRFAFYHGPPLRVSALVCEPQNSLVHQSYHSHERRTPLNGDGFGLAWYTADGEAGLFRSLTPAWNNANLASLAGVIESGCILAHVRAASPGLGVSEVNCHPFVVGRIAFMHNGLLGGFGRLRRALLGSLSDEAFDAIQGRTDSEHVFALVLDRLRGRTEDLDARAFGDALRGALADALELSRRHAPGEDSWFNVVVTDGRCAAVSRFTTAADQEGESLYWSHGRRYVCEDGVCRMRAAHADNSAILVSSERLSEDPGWEPVPRNHLLLIEADGTTRLEALSVP